MNLFKTISISLLASLCMAAQADDILIRDANVHTMTNDGTHERTDVLISGGKIKRIGKNLTVPQGVVHMIDAEGKTLTAGFVCGYHQHRYCRSFRGGGIVRFGARAGRNAARI